MQLRDFKYLIPRLKRQAENICELSLPRFVDRPLYSVDELGICDLGLSESFKRTSNVTADVCKVIDGTTVPYHPFICDSVNSVI